MLFLYIPAALSLIFFLVILGLALFPRTQPQVGLNGGHFRWADLCRRLRRPLMEGKTLKIFSPPVMEGEFSALTPEDRWVGYRVLEELGDPSGVDEAMTDLFSDAPWLQARAGQYLARVGEEGAFLPLTQAAQRGTLLSQAYVFDALLRLRPPPLPVLLGLAQTGQSHLVRLAVLELPRYPKQERETLLEEILPHLREEHAAPFLHYVEWEKEEAVLESLFFRIDAFPPALRDPFMDLFFLRHPVDRFAAFLEGKLSTMTGPARLSVIGVLGRAHGGRDPASALRFISGLKTESEKVRYLQEYGAPGDVLLQTADGILPTLFPALAEVLVQKLKEVPTEASMDLLLKALEAARYPGEAVLKGIAAMDSYPRPLALKGCFQLLSGLQNPVFQDMVRKKIAELEGR
jgi:hypothetical protein